MVSRGKTRLSRRERKYLTEEHVRCLSHLHFGPRVPVEGAYTGKHKSPLRGHSQEFTDYRQYFPGDEIRKIDWKVYARTDRHIIKLSEHETVMTCYLLVDSSASMGFGGAGYESYFGPDDLSKFDYAGLLAAAVCYVVIKQGDKVGLTLFDTKIKRHIPPGGTYGHLHELVRLLETNELGRRTSIAEALRQAYPLLKYRGVLIVISDLLDDPDALFEALDMYRYRNFEVILFHVLHKHELELPSLPSVNFIDSESGERLTSIPADIRSSYDQQFREYLDRMATIAASRSIDYELISTATTPHAALEQYVQRRGRAWHR
jgi:uncharacterized protein (DUF58 family)